MSSEMKDSYSVPYYVGHQEPPKNLWTEDIVVILCKDL